MSDWLDGANASHFAEILECLSLSTLNRKSLIILLPLYFMPSTLRSSTNLKAMVVLSVTMLHL